MEIIKKSMVALVLLLVVVVLWVGLYIYFESSEIDINPNAESYVSQLQEKFDIEMLDEVTGRTESSFPISPEVYFSLEGKD